MEDERLKTIKSVLRSLIILSPNGITIPRLRENYCEQEGSDIPHAAFGFTRLNDFLNSLKDTCYIRTAGSVSKVYAIKSEASNHIKKLVQEQKTSRRRRSYYDRNTNRNKPRTSELAGRPCNWSSSYQPIRNTESPNNNSRRYLPVDVLSSDESSTIDSVLCNHSPSHEQATSSSARQNDLNQNHQPNASTTQNIAQIQEFTSLKKMNTTKTKHYNYNINPSNCKEAIPILNDDDEVFRIGIPKNVAKLGAHIAQSRIPRDVQRGSVLEIVVSEINNPFRFWFHILNEQYELRKLMNDIGEYYSSCLHDELKLPASQACIGQLCAVLVLGMWHRAEVVHPINGDGEVRVYCIDFGTIALVSVMHVKYLLEKYCTVPSQAFRGCLAYIQPIGLRWKREASFYFLSLVPDAMIYAKVEDIDYEDQVLRLLLIDTNFENDVQINIALVAKGIAKPMLSKEGPNGPIKRHYCERHPTFEMLEKAKYPSLAEIGVMLKKGLDFEAMQDESIIPELDISFTNLKFDEKIETSFCELPTTSIQHEVSSDNNIQDGSSSISHDDISSGSFESIISVQNSSYPAPQLNRTLQARELSGVVKLSAAGSVLTLNEKSRDTMFCPPRTLYSDSEDKDIQLIFEPTSQVSSRFQDRELLLPRDMRVSQQRTTCLPQENGIIPESNISCQNLEIDEQMGKVVASKSTQLDKSSEKTSPNDISLIQLDVSSPRNNSQTEISIGSTMPQLRPLINWDIINPTAEPEVSPDSLPSIQQGLVETTFSSVPKNAEHTKAEHINSQPNNNGSTESPELLNICDEHSSGSRWHSNQSFDDFRQSLTEITLPAKSVCKDLGQANGAAPIKNLPPAPVQCLISETKTILDKTSTLSARPARTGRNHKTNFFNNNRPMEMNYFSQPFPAQYQRNQSMLFPMPFPSFPFQNFPPDWRNSPFLPPNLMSFLPNMAQNSSYYRNNPPPHMQHYSKF